jgi:MFS family permease
MRPGPLGTRDPHEVPALRDTRAKHDTRDGAGPRRITLICLISFFPLGQVAGALAPSYSALITSRVVSAFACAGPWPSGREWQSRWSRSTPVLLAPTRRTRRPASPDVPPRGLVLYTAPELNARMCNVASAAPRLAGATVTASFTTGNTVGPWPGGVVISAGSASPRRP